MTIVFNDRGEFMIGINEIGLYEIKIDFGKMETQITNNIIYTENDFHTAKIKAELVKNEEIIDLTDIKVEIKIMTASGATMEHDVDIVDSKNGLIEYTFADNALYEGINYFQLILTQDKQMKISPKLTYKILDVIDDSGIMAEPNYPILIQLVDEVKGLKEDTDKFLETSKTNENVRIENEKNRVQQENDRQVASKNMQDTFNEKIKEIDNVKNELVQDVDDKIKEVEASKSNMETTVSKKITELDTEFKKLQNQDVVSEVDKARDGEKSLNARLERDLAKGKMCYETVEGSYISTDNTLDSYLQNIEIKGSTIQNPNNLADIKSVGDEAEGQELYSIPIKCTGKNLCNPNNIFTEMIKSANPGQKITYQTSDNGAHKVVKDFLCKKGQVITMSCKKGNIDRGFIYELDKDDNVLLVQSTPGRTKTIQHKNTVRCTIYLSQDVNNIVDDTTIQIEYGTQATQYEPYKEYELNVLSPTSLEKVGDIADRIIEKDGVWGVEKNNILSIVPPSAWKLHPNQTEGYLSVWTDTYSLNNATEIQFSDCNKFAICKGFKVDNHTVVNGEMVTIHQASSVKWVFARVSTSKAKNLEEFKNLIGNGLEIIYNVAKPQFIPLPHNQQIKLRTFANQTNISFLTEIEGTIKADVPKNLGATVNSNTQAIQDLNKDLERVKRLEEATTTTITTDSNFVTVEETSNGYLSDIKLEGKTLVNNYTVTNIETTTDTFKARTDNRVIDFKTTIINHTSRKLFINTNKKSTGEFYKTVEVNPNNPIILNDSDWFISSVVGKTTDGWNDSNKNDLKNMVILEGDYTQNPPQFFEGMKSVGDGVDEIVVSSVKGDGNLFDMDWFKTHGLDPTDVNSGHLHQKELLPGYKYLPNTQYKVMVDFVKVGRVEEGALAVVFDYTDSTNSVTFLRNGVVSATSIPNKTVKGCYISYDVSATFNIKALSVSLTNVDTIVPIKQDKKKVLYYDTETQTWKKPILREWDSIEKHSDGKYYYHKRSEKIIFNGSETMNLDPTPKPQVDTLAFALEIHNRKNGMLNLICDKFNVKEIYNTDKEGVRGFGASSSILIRISKSKLETQNIEGFKKWLQTNNVEVVYQLAKEEVYECTPIDLVTFENGTNYTIECGAISPKTTLKCVNYIGNVINTLKEKVSNLEDKLYKTNLANFTVALNTLDTKLKLEQLTKAPK